MTKAEWEQHRREGHANYHAGCKHCVKSRAIADQHRRVDRGGHEEEDDNRLPTIGADLCFMGSAIDEDKLTTLVIVDGKSGSLFAHPSPDKAMVNGEYSETMITKVTEDIDSLGYDRVTFMTDKEVAMTALQARVKRRREKAVILQNAPKGDSQSNGLAEKAVRDIEEQVRTMRSCLEADMGARLSVSHPVFAWMVEASADYLNRFRESRPGSTPTEVIRGQHQPRKMADFGECVFFLPAKDNKEGTNKADERFSEGVWLGMNPRTGEAIIGTENGVEMARTVRRKVESEAFDRQKILAIKVAP